MHVYLHVVDTFYYVVVRLDALTLDFISPIYGGYDRTSLTPELLS